MYIYIYMYTLRYPTVFSGVHPVCCCCCIPGNYGSAVLCNDDDRNNKNIKPVLWTPWVCVVTKRYDMMYRRPGNRLLLGRSFDFRFRAERDAEIIVRVTMDTTRNACSSFPSKRNVHETFETLCSDMASRKSVLPFFFPHKRICHRNYELTCFGPLHAGPRRLRRSCEHGQNYGPSSLVPY